MMYQFFYVVPRRQGATHPTFSSLAYKGIGFCRPDQNTMSKRISHLARNAPDPLVRNEATAGKLFVRGDV